MRPGEILPNEIQQAVDSFPGIEPDELDALSESMYQSQGLCSYLVAAVEGDIKTKRHPLECAFAATQVGILLGLAIARRDAEKAIQ